jgi:hypothetical protein
MRPPSLLALLLLPLALLGCDLPGIESATALAARRDAEGKAIGGACRHAARSIEQCYETNRRADKAAVFAGWREMNDYMRESKLEAQPAQSPQSAHAAPSALASSAVPAAAPATASATAPATAQQASPAPGPARKAGA